MNQGLILDLCISKPSFLCVINMVRATEIEPSFCVCGDCGAAVGTGIFVSLVTGATPLSKEEWRLSNMMTSKSLLSVANHGGPRCCKRNTFLSIMEAVDFSEENLNVAIKIDKSRKCDYSAMNAECLRNGCPFYSKPTEA